MTLLAFVLTCLFSSFCSCDGFSILISSCSYCSSVQSNFEHKTFIMFIKWLFVTRPELKSSPFSIKSKANITLIVLENGPSFLVSSSLRFSYPSLLSFIFARDFAKNLFFLPSESPLEIAGYPLVHSSPKFAENCHICKLNILAKIGTLSNNLVLYRQRVNILQCLRNSGFMFKILCRAKIWDDWYQKSFYNVIAWNYLFLMYFKL